ncbi:glycosyltransferase [Stenotrophomonas terrae]|uniref:glycosyltransferase n=1 Tax=Stenotrophomonas terrae TaxID=405446 RepID=UPI00320A886C
MKLLALTYGTEGDTRPLSMLCRGLIDAGHEVILLAYAGTLGSAQALGVPHQGLEGDIQSEVTALVASGNGIRAASSGLAGIAMRHTASWMRQANNAAEGCDAVLSGGLAAFIGMSVAEHRQLPLIGTGMIPITPTRAFASSFLPPNHVPSLLNRLSYHLVNQLIWRQFRRPINQARTQVLGMPPRHSLWRDVPMLYGISPCLLPAITDWPSNHHVCGQWRAQDAQTWSPSPALQAFLDAGERPVYLGFGSMMGFDREVVLAGLLKMLDGRRVLLFPGWAGLPKQPLPANVHVIGNTPHEALFPRTSLVIHHGGSGTTHSACCAGVPSLVMPFAADQFFWADRLQKLGVAPAALSAKRLQHGELVAALAFAEQAQTRARAAALGRQMMSEDGVINAVRHIETLLRH